MTRATDWFWVFPAALVLLALIQLPASGTKRPHHEVGAGVDLTLSFVAPALRPGIDFFLSDHGLGISIMLPEPDLPHCNRWREMVSGREQRCL